MIAWRRHTDWWQCAGWEHLPESTARSKEATQVMNRAAAEAVNQWTHVQPHTSQTGTLPSQAPEPTKKQLHET